MKNIKIFPILLIAFMISSCSENINLDPFTALDASTGFKTRQDVEAALLGSYNGLQSGNYYGIRTWALSDMYAGTISHTGTFPSFAQVANKQLLANNTESTNI